MTLRRSFGPVLFLAAWTGLAVTLVGCPPAVDEIGGSGGTTESGGATGSGPGLGSGGAATGGSGTGGTPGSGGAETGGHGAGGTPGTGGAGTGGRGTGGTTGTGGAGTGGRTGGRGGITGSAGRGSGGSGMAGRAGATGGSGGSGGGGGGGGSATFAQVAMILGTSCGTGTCHQGGNHVDLRNNAGLYGRIVNAMPSGTNVMAGCTSMPLVVPGSITTGVIPRITKAPLTGCGARMPDDCTASGNPRACLTATQTATIDAWVMAGAPM